MLRRIVPATAAAALLLAGVTGCSAQQAQASDCTSVLQPGAMSDGTKVLGAFGDKPQVSVPKNVSIESTQRTVVDAGPADGRVATEQSVVGVNMAFFASTGGDALYESPGFSKPSANPELLLVSKDASNPLSEAVRCTVPGDRVVLALSPTDSAQLAGQLGAPADAKMVAVIDVDSTAPLRADGSLRGLPNGYPAIVTNDDGRPGLVLPPTEAPGSTTSAVRIEGDGKTVTADDSVVGQVLSVDWTGKVLQNTWESSIVRIGSEADVAQSGNTYRAQLNGKKVGSQVVVLEHESGSTPRVVVVDIVGVN